MKLGLGRSRFHDLRVKALQGALDALRPGVPGRPRKGDAVPARVVELEEKLVRMQRELDGARVRAEVALAMPDLLRILPSRKKGLSAKRATTRG